MRQIGKLPSEAEAQRLVAHLVTLQISASAAEENGGWTIWVRDENALSRAAEELRQFQANPADPRYDSAAQKAQSLLQQEQARIRAAQNNLVEMNQRWRRRSWKRIPVTIALIVISSAVSVITDFGDRNLTSESDPDSMAGGVFDQLCFVGRGDYLASDGRPLASIQRGQLWRLVTPIFLHGNVWHLVFNMFVLYQFGSALERRYGGPWLALVVVFTGVCGNLGQALLPVGWGGTPFAIGMSGGVYGLLGYFLNKSTDPSFGMRLDGQTVFVMLVWLALGFVGVLDHVVGGRIANWAHLFGLLGGVLLAWCETQANRRRH